MSFGRRDERTVAPTGQFDTLKLEPEGILDRTGDMLKSSGSGVSQVCADPGGLDCATYKDFSIAC
jgi:hypothetical protein